jgi:ring-1,2-phenylacetyl-CoA epoxidase subunit PaaE
MNFIQSTIIQLHQATPTAKTITLQCTSEWDAERHYKPGQFITIKMNIRGKELKRSYSVHGVSKDRKRIQITVKDSESGMMSSFLNTHAAVGDEVFVSKPMGRFVCHPESHNYKSYYFFAAGSGITPVYAMIQAILENEPQSVVYLLYGNRRSDDIIFLGELNYLDLQYKEQFQIQYLVSDAYSDWKSIFESEGKSGRINAQEIDLFLKKFPPFSQDCEYYICGPNSMNSMVIKHLLYLDVEDEHIHIESYGDRKSEAAKSKNQLTHSLLEAVVYDALVKVDMHVNETVLSALKRSNKAPKHSCESGICGACMGQLKEGEVQMKSNSFLSQKEVEGGKILSCQSMAKSESLKVEFRD